MQINTINDTHLECSWASPSGNGDILVGFEVSYNSLSGLFAPDSVTTNMTWTTDPAFSTNVVQDGPNTCYVRSMYVPNKPHQLHHTEHVRNLRNRFGIFSIKISN